MVNHRRLWLRVSSIAVARVTPPSAYGFWLVVVGDEGAVIEVWMDAGDDSGFDEAVSSFSVPNPPARPLVGQLAFAPSEYLVF